MINFEDGIQFVGILLEKIYIYNSNLLCAFLYAIQRIINNFFKKTLTKYDYLLCGSRVFNTL